MKKLALALAVFGLLAAGRGAQAVIGTVDAVPAATLLLPYFEVDLTNADGVNTLFSINNASATAILAHVTLWTDLSVPTFDFNIYLTGYDVQTVSVRDIFHGIVPRTASVGQDPGDTISPKGNFSQDINFASCTGQLPPPVAPASFQAHLAAAHTGGFSAILGGCSGWTAADNREPLSTNFATRFINGGAFTGGTSLIAWRDSKVNQGAFKCTTLPSWYPLGQEQIVIFDEQEHPEVPQTFPFSP